jgi:nucleolar GTP-binding protein
MNLGNLSKIEESQFYFEKAIQQSSKIASGVKSSSKMRHKGPKRLEIVENKRISTMAKIMVSDIQNIEKSFPTLDNLPLFYQELIDNVIGLVKLKKSLSGLRWLRNKINELSNINLKEIQKSNNNKEIHNIRKKFLGRVSSMYKKIGKDYAFLDEARKKFRNFPNIKTHIKTVCIAGYPNVGKSTLLSKLTTADPEINSYPFTTKSLMVGYIGKKLQLIDTPGTFREELMKMNYIERQAFLALKYLSESIIFVFDLSESCGYSLKDQESLFKTINKKFADKDIFIYVSKSDLIDEKLINDFKNKNKNYQLYYNPKILKIFLKKLV